MCGYAMDFTFFYVILDGKVFANVDLEAKCCNPTTRQNIINVNSER